jgi:hypothetical protein
VTWRAAPRCEERACAEPRTASSGAARKALTRVRRGDDEQGDVQHGLVWVAERREQLEDVGASEVRVEHAEVDEDLDDRKEQDEQNRARAQDAPVVTHTVHLRDDLLLCLCQLGPRVEWAPELPFAGASRRVLVRDGVRRVVARRMRGLHAKPLVGGPPFGRVAALSMLLLHCLAASSGYRPSLRLGRRRRPAGLCTVLFRTIQTLVLELPPHANSTLIRVPVQV